MVVLTFYDNYPKQDGSGVHPKIDGEITSDPKFVGGHFQEPKGPIGRTMFYLFINLLLNLVMF